MKLLYVTGFKMACAPVPAAVACTRKTVGFCESPVLRRYYNIIIIFLLEYNNFTITYYSFFIAASSSITISRRAKDTNRSPVLLIFSNPSTSLPSFNFKRVLLRMENSGFFFIAPGRAGRKRKRDTLKQM